MKTLNWTPVSEMIEVQEDWYLIGRIDSDERCVTTYLALESGVPVIYQFDATGRANHEHLSRGTING